MQFTINNIDPDTREVTVTYDIDSVPQVLSELPLDSPDSLLQVLNDYGIAYEAGLNTRELAAEVQALVGTTQTVVAPSEEVTDPDA